MLIRERTEGLEKREHVRGTVGARVRLPGDIGERESSPDGDGGSRS